MRGCEVNSEGCGNPGAQIELSPENPVPFLVRDDVMHTDAGKQCQQKAVGRIQPRADYVEVPLHLAGPIHVAVEQMPLEDVEENDLWRLRQKPGQRQKRNRSADHERCELSKPVARGGLP